MFYSDLDRNMMANQLGRLRQARNTMSFNPMRPNQPSPNMNTTWDNNSNQIEEEPLMYERFRLPKPLIIPWRGRILTPTVNQLREFKGDLNLISQVLGSREPSGEERNYKIRLTWKGFVIWPTPYQLSLAKGDLNALLDICDHKSPLQSNPCFRQRNDGSHWRNSNLEF